MAFKFFGKYRTYDYRFLLDVIITIIAQFQGTIARDIQSMAF
jgi:hypothetical protein